MQFRKHYIKILVVFIGAVYGFVFFGNVRVSAIVPGVTLPVPTAQTVDIPGKIWRLIDSAIKVAVDTGFVNQLINITQDAAYNAAVKVATGDAGQKPLIWDWNSIWKSTRDEAIGSISSEIINATSRGGNCETTGLECSFNTKCPLLAVASPNHSLYDLLIEQGGQPWIVISDDAEFKAGVDEGIFVPESKKEDKCNLPLTSKFGPVDICSIRSPAAEIVIKTKAINLITPPKPRCGYSELKQNYESLKGISGSDLVRVRTLFNRSSNELAIIHNLTQAAREQRTIKLWQTGLKAGVGDGAKPVEDPVTGKTKTPQFFVQEEGKQALVFKPAEALKQTGNLVVDTFLGTFVKTFIQKRREIIFDRGFNPEIDPTVAQGSSLLNRITGVAAAKLRFAKLLEHSKISSSFKNEHTLLAQLSSAVCDVSSQSPTQEIDPDAIREVNNCIIDNNFKDAVAGRLTVQEALNKGLLDGERAFGVKSDGSGSHAIVGSACGPNDGCINDVYSLRSIKILKNHRIVSAGWVLAAEYIERNWKQLGKEFGINDLVKEYANPESPFYLLVDPNWQLKAPISIQERRAPGNRFLTETFIDNEGDVNNPGTDFNRDGFINKNDNTYIRQRGPETVDEKTCVVESADGSECIYHAYCTEEKPVWRVVGQTCEPQNASCQLYARGGDNARVSYLAQTTNQASACTAEVAGCRRYALTKDADGEWILSGISAEYGRGDLFVDRGAAECTARNAGCSQFLRLTDSNRNILPAPVVDGIIGDVITANGTIDTYGTFGAFFEPLHFGNSRIDCTSRDILGNLQDNDGNGYFDDNVACRMYTPRTTDTPRVPAVARFASVDITGAITAFNDECPSECVGYQPYEESVFHPLYPASRNVQFIPKTADQCSAAAEGCTEFTNLNEVAQGGEGREYYIRLRQCVNENDPSASTFFTWEGSEDTGFQLRSWQLVADAGAPLHAGNPPSYTGCDETIYRLTQESPDDPAANPDCREYINANLDRYYRFHSRVIFASDDCEQLRRTDDQQIYFALPQLSVSCRAQEAGCRRYQGNNTGNTQTIINTTFESADALDGWLSSPGGDQSNLFITADSIFQNGASVNLQGQGIELSHTVPQLKRKSYLLTLWAKGSGSVNARIQGSGGTVSFASGPSSFLSNEWRLYVLGPAIVNFDPAGDEYVVIDGWNGPTTIDTIKLAETKDLFLISDSWDTPQLCESPQSQLFCEEYRDDQGRTRYIKSFTRLCEEEFIGCEAMVNTHNSEFADPQPYNGITLAQDSVSYIVNKPQYACQDTAKGCTELGLLTTTRDGTQEFTTAYRIIDPDTFEVSVCSAPQELCEEYVPQGKSSGFVTQFKNPLDRLCEYKTNQRVVGRTDLVSGWFKVRLTRSSAAYEDVEICELTTDTAPRVTVCDKDSINSDSCYTYTCLVSQSSCAEFQDPLNPIGCNSEQLDPQAPDRCDFYYLLKDTLPVSTGESTICTNEIGKPELNSANGCVGFFETSKGLDSRNLRADCQPGCDLRLDALGNGIPVTPSPDCTDDPLFTLSPQSKPGCRP